MCICRHPDLASKAEDPSRQDVYGHGFGQDGHAGAALPDGSVTGLLLQPSQASRWPGRLVSQR
jgi:hypothetical protein